ncbi:protein kinase [Actinoplanes sp. NPDC049681]|uniref:protein kinase domain-containing protein n=1 Tax=Actinoplanes sp. NPDC049681 TaxID=3363905 RepID=UPI0037914C12
MSTTDLPGSSLLAGRYRLVERLGAGGMSVVWRGFDEVLGRQVAVKVLPPSTSADPSFRRRLRAEAQAAARLSHPHITNVYDYGEATTVDGEPVPYVVMELVDGESLAAVLARVRRLPWPAAVRICSEVSAALAAAHARGIVHRDVTPANVMLTPAGAKVVDFGISALIGENDIDPDGSLLGTPAYLAPERLEGGQVSPATDVYAVGLLIYRTLIGQLPWDVGTTTALLRAHQYTEPEPMPPVEGLPSAVSALIARCLEKRPSDRPSSAELAHVLGTVSAGVPAARAFVPDWADNGEDTTILPSARSYTDGLGRLRPGHARVADSAPPGRGVASVPGTAGGAAAAGGLSAAGGSAAGGLAAAGGHAAGGLAAAGHAAPDYAARGHAAPGGVAAGGYAAAAGGGASVAEMSPEADAPVSPAPGSPAHAVSVDEVEAAVGAAAQPVANSAPSVPLAPPQRGGRNSRFGPVPPAAPVPSGLAGPGAGTHGPAGSDGSGDDAPALRSALGAGPAGPPARADEAGAPPSRAAGVPPLQRPPGAPPAGATRPGGRAGTTKRRALIIAAGSAALVVGGGAWALAQGDNSARTVVPDAVGTQPAQLVGANKCVVSYAVWSDDGGRFKAAVTIANRDIKAVRNWKLWFLMPGDQVVSGNGKLKLDQQARAVTVDTGRTLNPQATETMQFTGRYKASNAAPMVFQLDGQTCETFVSPKPGEPSRPVERLSNGTVRLGPVPTRDTPLPGISIDPSGVVVPVPVKPGTGSAPPGSPPPTSGPPAIDPPPNTDDQDDDDPPAPEPPTTPPSSSASPSTDQSTGTNSPPPVDTTSPDPVDQDSPPANFG